MNQNNQKTSAKNMNLEHGNKKKLFCQSKPVNKEFQNILYTFYEIITLF